MFAEELHITTMKNDAKFEDELTCPFKIEIRWGIWQISTEALKSLKKLHFNGFLLNKVYNVWAKKVKSSYVVMCHDSEKWCKIWRKLAFGLENSIRIGQIFTRAPLRLKAGTLMESFYPEWKCISLNSA